MRIEWTAEAIAELAAIEARIAQEAPQAAHAMVRRLIERCEQLATLPHGAAMLPRYERDDLRMLYERPYRIVY
jgi:toxin ParE1/3/4